MPGRQPGALAPHGHIETTILEITEVIEAFEHERDTLVTETASRVRSYAASIHALEQARERLIRTARIIRHQRPPRQVAA